MVFFNYETDFKLSEEEIQEEWISKCILQKGFSLGELQYIFCDDAYLLKLNLEFLQHDTLTDIISFDYTVGKEISGDIFISIERVAENAKEIGIPFEEEIKRVMVHGVLHYMGYKDKTAEEKEEMRKEETNLIKLNN